MTERTNQVKKLSEEYEHYSSLAAIEEERIRPLMMELERTVNKGKKWERWVGFIISIFSGILIFILGIWLGPWVNDLFK